MNPQMMGGGMGGMGGGMPPGGGMGMGQPSPNAPPPSMIAQQGDLPPDQLLAMLMQMQQSGGLFPQMQQTETIAGAPDPMGGAEPQVMAPQTMPDSLAALLGMGDPMAAQMGGVGGTPRTLGMMPQAGGRPPMGRPGQGGGLLGALGGY